MGPYRQRVAARTERDAFRVGISPIASMPYDEWREAIEEQIVIGRDLAAALTTNLPHDRFLDCENRVHDWGVGIDNLLIHGPLGSIDFMTEGLIHIGTTHPLTREAVSVWLAQMLGQLDLIVSAEDGQ